MKYIALFVILLMVGCTAPVDKLADVVPKTEPTETGVTRVFTEDTVAPGAQTKIKMYINLQPEQTYYLYEEGVPAGFKVVGGSTDANNKLKVIKIQGAVSTVLEYTVTAPDTPGTYTWSGEYALEGMENPAPIMGSTTLIVQ